MQRPGRVLRFWPIWPATLWTLVFFVLALGAMLALSFAERAGDRTVAWPSLANYQAFVSLGGGALVKALVNSIEVTLAVTAISVALAYPLAYILAYRVPARWQRLLLILIVLPFWTSYVVRSYSWLLVLSENGVISTLLLDLGVIDRPIGMGNTRGATILGFVHFFVMLLTLTIFSNLVQLSPNYARAAADLGASGWQVIRLVILPLTLPGVMTGAFLTFVLCIGDYITPQILGGNNELTLPQLIMLQLGRRGDFPMASALSVVLMALVTLAYAASARWLKMDRV